MGLDTSKLSNLAGEVTKAVDVKKVAEAAAKDGKLDIKGAADVVKKEVTADEAKGILNAAKGLIK